MAKTNNLAIPEGGGGRDPLVHPIWIRLCSYKSDIIKKELKVARKIKVSAYKETRYCM